VPLFWDVMLVLAFNLNVHKGLILTVKQALLGLLDLEHEGTAHYDALKHRELLAQ
jgi:hypothetical protein